MVLSCCNRQPPTDVCFVKERVDTTDQQNPPTRHHIAARPDCHQVGLHLDRDKPPGSQALFLSRPRFLARQRTKGVDEQMENFRGDLRGEALRHPVSSVQALFFFLRTWVGVLHSTQFRGSDFTAESLTDTRNRSHIEGPMSLCTLSLRHGYILVRLFRTHSVREDQMARRIERRNCRPLLEPQTQPSSTGEIWETWILCSKCCTRHHKRR